MERVHSTFAVRRSWTPNPEMRRASGQAGIMRRRIAMTRGGMCTVLALFLCWAPYTRAQEPLFQKPQGPLLQRGTKELALSGTFDVQHEGDAFLDLRGSYGFFPRDDLEVGGFAQ